MGWEDDYFNCFKINRQENEVYHDGGLEFVDDPMEVCLSDLKLKRTVNLPIPTISLYSGSMKSV